MRIVRTIGMVVFLVTVITCVGLMDNTAVAVEYGIVLIDRSGSMTIERHTGNTRFEDAILAAQMDVQSGMPPIDEYSVMYFNGDDGIVVQEWFTSDKAVVNAALLAIPPAVTGPRTPLADAMCQVSEILKNMSGGRWLLGYTDGDENDSDGSFFNVCDPCDPLIGTGWLDYCDPSDLDPPCTDYQVCVAGALVGEAIQTWRCFNNPIVKSAGGAWRSIPQKNIWNGMRFRVISNRPKTVRISTSCSIFWTRPAGDGLSCRTTPRWRPTGTSTA